MTQATRVRSPPACPAPTPRWWCFGFFFGLNIQDSNAYPVFAQQNYSNPRAANGKLACANCHLNQKALIITSLILEIIKSRINNSFSCLSTNPNGSSLEGLLFFSFVIFWYSRVDSNHRPLVPQTSALTN